MQLHCYIVHCSNVEVYREHVNVKVKVTLLTVCSQYLPVSTKSKAWILPIYLIYHTPIMFFTLNAFPLELVYLCYINKYCGSLSCLSSLSTCLHHVAIVTCFSLIYWMACSDPLAFHQVTSKQLFIMLNDIKKIYLPQYIRWLPSKITNYFTACFLDNTNMTYTW